MGFSFITGQQTIMHADNASFDGTERTGALSANGQLWIGSGNSPHVVKNTLTAGTGVTITNGPGSIIISLTGGAVAVEHLTGNSGGILNPDGNNNFNTLGSGSITVVGSGSTLTAQLTGLTNHALQVGAGTDTLTQLSVGSTGQVLQANSAADPTWSTATYPSTTTINQILYSNTNNTVTGLATANNSTLTTGATGVPVLTSIAVNGGLLIGSASGPPLVGTLTAGTGVTITNAANAITINATGGGLTWTDVTGTSASMAVNNGYLADNAGLVTLTLPATAVQFSIIAVGGFGSGGWKIAQNANQSIQFGSAASTTIGITGSLSSTNRYDSVYMIAAVGGASTTWLVLNAVGNLTVI